MFRNLGKPIITNEHGSWAVLFIPIITAILSSKIFNLKGFLLILSSFFLFMSYKPAEFLLQNFLRKRKDVHNKIYNINWLIIYLIFGLIFGSLLVFYFNNEIIIMYFLTAFLIFFFAEIIKYKFGKNLAGDLLAMAGLTLVAPAYLQAVSYLSFESKFILWLLNFLFFASGAFYVYMKMKHINYLNSQYPKKRILSASVLNLAYHFILIFIIIYFIKVFPNKITIAIGFLPMFIHAVLGSFKINNEINFKLIGKMLLLHSLIFSISFYFF